MWEEVGSCLPMLTVYTGESWATNIYWFPPSSKHLSWYKPIHVDLDLFFVLCGIQQPGSYCDR